MTSVHVQEAASHHIDENYRYTRDQSGDEQAERFITGLFEAFGKIETREVMSRPVPAEFGVDGYFSAMSGTSSTGESSAMVTSAS